MLELRCGKLPDDTTAITIDGKKAVMLCTIVSAGDNDITCYTLETFDTFDEKRARAWFDYAVSNSVWESRN